MSSLSPASAPPGRAVAALALGAVVVAAVVVGAGLRVVGPGEFVLAAALAGAIGVAAIATRTSPAWMLSLGIVLSSMAGHWELVGIPGPAAPDRLLLAAGIIATLARVPAIRGVPEPRIRPSHIVLGIYSAYALGSALFVGTLLFEPVQQFDRMGLIAFGVFLVAPVAFARESDRRILLWALVGMGAYLSVTALLEVLAPPLVFPRFIADPSITRHIGRARGPFLEAEINGYAMFAALIASLIARTLTTSPRARTFTLLVAVGCALGILLTLSRGIWLGTLLGALVGVLMTPGLRRYLLPGLAGLALLVGAAFAVIPGLSERAGDRVGNQQTVWDRRNLNAAALSMVADRPLLGHGWNRFVAVADDYFWQGDEIPLTAANAKTGVHNRALAIASELGLIGLVLWAAAVVLALADGLLGPRPPALQPWRAGLAALAVAYGTLLMTTPAAIIFLLVLLLAWAGVAAGPRALQIDDPLR